MSKARNSILVLHRKLDQPRRVEIEPGLSSALVRWRFGRGPSIAEYCASPESREWSGWAGTSSSQCVSAISSVERVGTRSRGEWLSPPRHQGQEAIAPCFWRSARCSARKPMKKR